MNQKRKHFLTLLIFGIPVLSADLDETQISRFALLNDGPGIETNANTVLVKPSKTECQVFELFPELEASPLTAEEKKEAKRCALEFWVQTYGLRAEESLEPMVGVELDEDLEGLGSGDARVWLVRVEQFGDLNAVILINPESKEARAWGAKRDIKLDAPPPGFA